MKVWDGARIKLNTPASANQLTTDCTMGPGGLLLQQKATGDESAEDIFSCCFGVAVEFFFI